MTKPEFHRAASHVPLPVPEIGDPRLRVFSEGREGHRGKVVVYWAQAARRATSNQGLSLAIAEANRRRLPLLVYESIRVDHPFACDRFHAFVLEGARDAQAAHEARGARYAFFLPRSREEQRGMVRRLTELADLLVTDRHPTFVFPGHVQSVAARSACPVWGVDDNAVVPLMLFPKEEWAARTLRPKLAGALPDWLRPVVEPTCDVAPKRLDLPFEALDLAALDVDRAVASLPIDHDVPRVPSCPGGATEARKRLARFVARRLSSYGEDHNHPDEAATTGLSPYLHFGMISAREVALEAAWAHAPAEARDAFLEQLLVRRGLAFNLALTNPGHRTFDAVPSWAKQTIDKHRGDPRRWTYSRDELERAETHDEVWNAAQRELRETGVVHNYLRMLWGKCVIDWKRTPEEAFDDLLYLNDRWALDGRDPNTYASILWCFGKHDRPWGERPIHGTLRTMTTPQALKKLRMEDYMAKWGRGRGTLPFD